MYPKHGKIASLPRPIRLQLNERLERSEDGQALLDWVNALPEVQALMREDFEGAPINKQNLSDWRMSGFQEWLLRQELWEQTANIGDDARAMEVQLIDNVATVVAARYAELLGKWHCIPQEEMVEKLKVLQDMTRSVVQLQRSIHQGRRSAQTEDYVAREQTVKETQRTRAEKLSAQQNFNLIAPKAVLYEMMYGCDARGGSLMALYMHAIEHGLPEAELYLKEFNRTFTIVPSSQVNPGQGSTPDNSKNPAGSTSDSHRQAQV